MLYITDKLKHTRAGVHQKAVIFLACPDYRRLCIIVHLNEYLQTTSNFRGVQKQLHINFIKPHKPISRDTISHLVKICMTYAVLIFQSIRDTVQGQPRVLILHQGNLILKILWVQQDGLKRKHSSVFIILIPLLVLTLEISIYRFFMLKLLIIV